MNSTTKLDIESVKYVLTNYVYTFMLICGNFGNILNLILFFRKKLRNTSCNNYLLVSSVSNILALNIGIIPFIYAETERWQPTTIYCKIQNYLMNVSLQISRFLILMACIDRYALCSTNAYLRKLCNVHIARYYIIPSVILLWFLIPLHIPIEIFEYNGNCAYMNTAAIYNTIYSIIMIGLIPPILMIVFCFLIFHNLKLHTRRRQIRNFPVENNPLPVHVDRTEKRNEQILGLSLVQVFAYIISTTPYTIVRLYLVINQYDTTGSFFEHETNSILLAYITDMLRFVCPFTSFYLYVLVSQLYRTEMKVILLTIAKQCRSIYIKTNRVQDQHHMTTAIQHTNSYPMNEQHE